MIDLTFRIDRDLEDQPTPFMGTIRLGFYTTNDSPTKRPFWAKNLQPSLEHDSNDSNWSSVAAKSESAEVITIMTDKTSEHNAPL